MDPLTEKADPSGCRRELGASLAGSAARFAADCCERLVTPSDWNLKLTDDGSACCCVCEECFAGEDLHHCRNCGDWVCNAHSKSEAKVPWKGWLDPVRICDSCKDDVNLRLEALALKQLVDCKRSCVWPSTDELEIAVQDPKSQESEGNSPSSCSVPANKAEQLTALKVEAKSELSMGPSKTKTLDPTTWERTNQNDENAHKLRRTMQGTIHPWCKSVHSRGTTYRLTTPCLRVC